MNYLKHYLLLIRKAENRKPPTGYNERHHIFPKSIWGESGRIVVLTGREHYVAHALLWKGFAKRYGEKDDRTIKMCYAFYHMGAFGKYGRSHLYESARIERGKYMSNSQKGSLNHMYGKKMSQEAKDKAKRTLLMSGKRTGRPPGTPPWNKGIPRTEEEKAKISGPRGNIHTEEQKI